MADETDELRQLRTDAATRAFIDHELTERFAEEDEALHAALAGYSGIWLARALPAGGRLIALEISEQHAAVWRASLEHAGLSDRAEIRVGAADQLLPALQSDAPFDLIFIDADKPGYPTYLDWALRLSRPGSIIVADNCIRHGEPLRGDSGDAGMRAVGA